MLPPAPASLRLATWRRCRLGGAYRFLVGARDGERVKSEFTEVCHSEILALAEMVRGYRTKLDEGFRVRQPAARCRVCGRRANCRQNA